MNLKYFPLRQKNSLGKEVQTEKSRKIHTIQWVSSLCISFSERQDVFGQQLPEDANLTFLTVS